MDPMIALPKNHIYVSVITLANLCSYWNFILCFSIELLSSPFIIIVFTKKKKKGLIIIVWKDIFEHTLIPTLRTDVSPPASIGHLLVNGLGLQAKMNVFLLNLY